jgi:iron complex outermembrane receptor protein
MDFSNYQINQFVDLGGGQTAISLRNAAAARTYGAELEARFNVTKSLALGSNLAVTKAQFQDFPNGGGNGVNLQDNFLPHAPEFTSSVYFDFRHDLGPSGLMATVFGEHNHRSSSFSGPENLARQQIGARDIVNFRIGIGSAKGTWSLQAFVDNALNQKYLLTRERDFFGTLIVERGTPRTYGLTARLSF